MVYLAILWFLVSFAEIGLMYWINKKESELIVSIKKYGSVLLIGNGILCIFSCYKESINGFSAYWYFGIFSYLLCLTIYDLKFKELPDWLHIEVLLFYIGLWIAGKQEIRIQESGVVTIILAVVFGVLFLLKKEALGIGDMKLLLICSMYVGSFCFGILFRGMIVAFFVSLLLLLSKKATAKTELPFVPFLLLGALMM